MKPVKRLFVLYLLLFSSVSYGQQKPNIIYILADDLGYGDVSCLNENSKIQTSHIDALARDGMIFTDAHSSSSVCTPTRYGILTGRYNWRSHLQRGVLWSYDSMLITKDRATVASLLKESGYQTACIGKWHLGLNWQKDANGNIELMKPISFGPNEVGFDYFYGITASLDIPPYVYIKNDRVTATSIDSISGTKGKGFWRAGPKGNDFKHADVLPHLTAKATEYIETTARTKQPFFLYYPMTAPHTPILPSEEWLGRSRLNEYGDFVMMLDDMIGKIMRTVKESGIEDNTLIIFASDNGFAPAANLQELLDADHNPSYIFRGAKADIFEGGHRIPFIVKWPGKIKPGSRSEAVICLTDLMASTADITGNALKDNEGEDSYSLIPLFEQNGTYQRQYTIHHSIDGNFSIRDGKWKLEYAYGSGGWSVPTEKEGKANNMSPLQLYDLDKDIGEKNNVATLHPEIVERLDAA